MPVSDSYSETNRNSSIYGLSGYKLGQSFVGDGNFLFTAQLYLKKTGSPTGSYYIKVYAETHATAFGTDSLPTGTALATSDAFDVSTLTTSFTLTSFVFSGVNNILLTNGSYYVVTIEYSGGDVSNHVDTGIDDSSPSHLGNSSYADPTTWIIPSGMGTPYDLCFYINTLVANTYYFNASDAGPSDPDGVWFNDSRAFDGSTSTNSDSGGPTGNPTSYYLYGQGTNAPASGGTIVQVRARVYGSWGGASATITAEIVSTSTIGTPTITASPENWGNYVILSEPSGGWTWEKTQALEVYIYRSAGTGNVFAYKVEIEVLSEEVTISSSNILLLGVG